MKYYWFVSTRGMTEAEWSHEIGLGIFALEGDIDLYVSVMDGRFPTPDDFDYSSELLGADYVTISSTDPIFDMSHPNTYNASVGVVVVIGVQSKADVPLDYTLVVRQPIAPVIE